MVDSAVLIQSFLALPFSENSDPFSLVFSGDFTLTSRGAPKRDEVEGKVIATVNIFCSLISADLFVVMMILIILNVRLVFECG